MLITALEIVARQVVVSSLVIVKSLFIVEILVNVESLVIVESLGGGGGVRLVMMLVRLVVVERLFQDLR